MDRSLELGLCLFHPFHHRRLYLLQSLSNRSWLFECLIDRLCLFHGSLTDGFCFLSRSLTGANNGPKSTCGHTRTKAVCGFGCTVAVGIGLTLAELNLRLSVAAVAGAGAVGVVSGLAGGHPGPWVHPWGPRALLYTIFFLRKPAPGPRPHGRYNPRAFRPRVS